MGANILHFEIMLGLHPLSMMPVNKLMKLQDLKHEIARIEEEKIKATLPKRFRPQPSAWSSGLRHKKNPLQKTRNITHL